ncbi:MAG: hypothetical protein IT223_12525 [Crocinitomicaceae bacterium]|nr:hypothetical protein [Crocinitomicaceae bacterium]
MAAFRLQYSYSRLHDAATFRLMEWVMGFYLGLKGVERIAKNIGPIFKK